MEQQGTGECQEKYIPVHYVFLLKHYCLKAAVLRQTKKLLNIQQSGEEKFSLRCKRVGDVLRSVAKPTPDLRSVVKPLAKLRGVAEFI